MSLAGHLSEYSLAEIFHFVQDGNKTGVLSIEPDIGTSQFIKDPHYLSFQNGRIMSVANGSGLGNRGLLKLMAQRKWLDRGGELHNVVEGRHVLEALRPEVDISRPENAAVATKPPAIQGMMPLRRRVVSSIR